MIKNMSHVTKRMLVGKEGRGVAGNSEKSGTTYRWVSMMTVAVAVKVRRMRHFEGSLQRAWARGGG